MNTSIVATIKQNIKYFAANDRNYFEEIKAKINNEVKLSEVVLNAGFELKKAPKGELKMCCPFHQEKTASLHINDAKNLYYCFGCSVSGNLFTFVSEYHGKEGNDVIEFFAENYNINIDLRDNMPTQESSTPREKKAPKKAFKPIALPHLDLATFPEKVHRIAPHVIESKSVGNELKQLGVTTLRKTYYIYHDSPKTYRLRTEAFNKSGQRLSVLGDSGDKLKDFWWEHIDQFDMPRKGIPIDPNTPTSGRGSRKKLEIKLYRFSEAVDYGKGKIITLVEGEKDCETLRKVGLVAVSFNFGIESLKELDCDGFLIIGDNDNGGNAQLETVCKFCTDNQLPFRAVPISHFWMDAPPKADITDFYTQFCLDNCDGTPGHETNRAFVEMLRDLLVDVESDQDFSIGDFIAHSKTPNRKLQILEITDSYQDGDNGMLSGYYVKGFGFDQTPHFIAKSVVVPYIETATDREKREQEEAFTKAMAALDVIDLVVENAVIPSEIESDRTEETENAITTELPEIPKTEEIIPELPENSGNVRGIIFNKTAREPLGKGKTVTRREWTAKTAQIYIDYYHQGTLIPALSGRLDRSGVELGKLRLTSEPYQQPLSEMTKEDLIKEGFPTWTLENFYYQFFDGDNAKNVWVLEFEYFPNEQKQKFDDLQDQYRELTTEQREEIYTEIALNELYSDPNFPYCAIGGELYHWTGTHYEKCKEIFEKRRISRWLVSFSPKLALPEKINHVYQWTITNLPVDPDTVNPVGINLLNGVLVPIFDKTGKGSVGLQPHNPKNIYNYCAPIKYDPSVETTHFNRLMECLDPKERKIFLRTMALAFDLPYFKSKLGRPRALLLKGDGSNGKDALNICLKQIFGVDGGFVETNLGAFKNYDAGKQFALAKLNGAVISWSSENVDNINIEKLGALKAAISGDVLQCEFKGQDEKPFNPKCLFVFNCNNPPKFPSKQTAIATRWAILQFTKTYKPNPNKRKGELKADPRFRDDLEFIQTFLAPAMLNALVEELKDLAINGIDFSPVDINLEELQEEESHLFSFAKDINLKQDVDLEIGVSELWELLQSWYIDNGVLEIIPMEKGKDKRIWNDQANPYDKNVTGSNQVFKRFKKLFPTIRLRGETIDQSKVGRSFIKGIGISASCDSYPRPARDSASLTGSLNEATNEAETLATSVNESNEAKVSIPCLIEKIKPKTLAEKIKLLGSLFSEQELKMFGLSTPLLAETIDTCYNLLPPTITATLRDCLQSGNPQSLIEVRSEYPAELLRLAAQSLTKDEKITLKKWVNELDTPKVEKPSYKVGDRVIKSSDNSIWVVEKTEGSNLHCRNEDTYAKKELLNVSFVRKV